MQQPNYQQIPANYYPNNANMGSNYAYPSQAPPQMQMNNQQMYNTGYPQQQQPPPPYYNNYNNYYNMQPQFKQPEVSHTPPPPSRPLSQPAVPLPAEKQQQSYASLTPLQPISQMQPQGYYQQAPAQYNQMPMQPAAQAPQQYPINPNYYSSPGYYYPPQTSQ
jgi:hypothetical protein